MKGKVKPVLRLDFVDFNGINKTDNFFTRILQREYTIEISDRPDLLIFQEGGHLNRLYTCRKLFWTGESILPDFERTDYALTCHYLDDPRHLRHPYYVWGCDCSAEDLLRKAGDIDAIVQSKRQFCSFVVSNANRRRTHKRIEFFHQLDARKKITSGGRYCNTIGGPLAPGGAAKYAFNVPHKFNLCFENKEIEGYTTEKLVEAMWARCVPIYWGNPRVGEEFNTRSMLCRYDYPDDASFIEKILEVDRDEEQYRSLLEEPYFIDNTPNQYYDEDRLMDFFERIISDRSTPVSHRKRFWQLGRWRLAKHMHKS